MRESTGAKHECVCVIINHDYYISAASFCFITTNDLAQKYERIIAGLVNGKLGRVNEVFCHVFFGSIHFDLYTNFV